jgi:hypothetical protein
MTEPVSAIATESILEKINTISVTNHTIHSMLRGRHTTSELVPFASVISDLVDLQSRRLAELDKCCRLHG